jgi:hypothetical protein
MALFGPDNSLSINFSGTHIIKVPAGDRLLFRFGFSAEWENSIIVYSKQTLERLVARNNYFGGTDEYITDNSGNPNILEIIVTAWHKKSRPKGKEPWHQSMRFKVQKVDDITIVGFSDAGGDFFHNAEVFVINLP